MIALNENLMNITSCTFCNTSNYDETTPKTEEEG